MNPVKPDTHWTDNHIQSISYQNTEIFISSDETGQPYSVSLNRFEVVNDLINYSKHLHQEHV